MLSLIREPIQGEEQMRDPAAERAAIDAEIEGMTLGHVLERNARNHGDTLALAWKDGTGWASMTWREYRERVAELAVGLSSIGFGPGDFAAIMMRNRPEHLIADLGIVHRGGRPVSFYNTLAPDQIAYIAGHCDAKVAIVEDREFLERWEKVRSELPKLETVIVLEDADEFAEYDWVLSWDEIMERGRSALSSARDDFEAAWKRVEPDEPATLIYTSGTTGAPKGVVLTHFNVLWTVASARSLVLEWQPGGKYVSYLPLAHGAERTIAHYLGMWVAGSVYFCPEVREVFDYVPQVRPYAFLGVPRVWEKLQAGIVAKLSAEPNERKRKIALSAIETGRRAVALETEGEPIPLGLRLRRGLMDRLVLSKIRHGIGLDDCDVAISGAAPITVDTLQFFAGIGLPITEVYGMTECTAPSIANRPGEARIGTVGKPMAGVEIKLLDDGELLMRGGHVSPGYYKEPDMTAETFDDEGWLHSGDIATIDDDGFVSIIDRKKELIITAGGKNISPSHLEGLLKLHPLISQVCVVGDRKPYIAALVVLDAETAPAWAADNGIGFSGIEEFSADERVVAEVQRAVDAANEQVSRVEAIKRFTILPTEWTPDSEELTPTLKLKRRVIHDKYSEEIEGLYATKV
jgi:long-chain acyl-CoA synthetase